MDLPGSISYEYEKAQGESHKDQLYYYSTEFDDESLMSDYSLGLMFN
jgi:hypothetical protein